VANVDGLSKIRSLVLNPYVLTRMFVEPLKVTK